MGDSSDHGTINIPAKADSPQLFHEIQHSLEQDLEESKRKRFSKEQHENTDSKRELSFTTLKTTSATAPVQVLTALSDQNGTTSMNPPMESKEKQRMCKAGSPCYQAGIDCAPT